MIEVAETQSQQHAARYKKTMDDALRVSGMTGYVGGGELCDALVMSYKHC
jgi:hypothetical protein